MLWLVTYSAVSLLGEPLTLTELCNLPQKSWSQLGVWLKNNLQTYRYSFSDSAFEMFLAKNKISERYAILYESLSNEKKETFSNFLAQTNEEQMREYQTLLEALDSSQRKAVKDLFRHLKLQRKELVVALVKSGLRKEAEKICQSKG